MIFLYVKFDDRFVYIGGIQSSVFSASNTPIPSEDYSQDWATFLDKTGVKSLTISSNGFVTEKLPKELFVRFYNSVAKGTKLECRLEEIINDNSYITVTGQFILTELNKSDSVNEPLAYNFSLQSSGSISFS